jgi:hypothetical protein
MKSFKLGNYTISNEGVEPTEGAVVAFNLNEEFCKQMVTEVDNGERYSFSSRYYYTTEYDKSDELHCGTANAAVQRQIINHFKMSTLRFYVKITKINN